MDKGAFRLEVGRRISDARMKKKMRADKLAEYVGITTQSLSNIECGKVDCKSSTMYRICLALGISADYALGLQKRDTAGDIPIMLSNLDDEEKAIVEQLIRSLVSKYHK